MVLTSWPSAITASVVQDFTALPSRWTTQAPHCEVSQPTWVPVNLRFSRRNWTNRVRGSILALTGLPFTIMEILAISTLLSAPPRIGRTGIRSFQAHNMGPFSNGQPHPGHGFRGLWAGLALHRLGEIGKKFVGQFLGRPVDQALAELRQLAADLRLDVVTEQRAAVLFGKRHRRAALGESGDAALAFARDLVAVPRVEIAQRDLALEARRHRPDLHFGGRAKAVLVGFLQLLAAGDAGLQHVGIIELVPYGLARRRKLDFAVHCHGHGGLQNHFNLIPQ